MPRMALSFGVALAVAGCASGAREAPGGALLLTVDHATGRAIEHAEPAASQGFTELRYLGRAGPELHFLTTVHAPAAGGAAPRVSTSFALDPAQERKVALLGHVVVIEAARPDRLRYRIRRAPDAGAS